MNLPGLISLSKEWMDRLLYQMSSSKTLETWCGLREVHCHLQEAVLQCWCLWYRGACGNTTLESVPLPWLAAEQTDPASPCSEATPPEIDRAEGSLVWQWLRTLKWSRACRHVQHSIPSRPLRPPQQLSGESADWGELPLRGFLGGKSTTQRSSSAMSDIWPLWRVLSSWYCLISLL